jgi:hypothetical protein
MEMTELIKAWLALDAGCTVAELRAAVGGVDDRAAFTRALVALANDGVVVVERQGTRPACCYLAEDAPVPPASPPPPWGGTHRFDHVEVIEEAGDALERAGIATGSPIGRRLMSEYLRAAYDKEMAGLDAARAAVIAANGGTDPMGALA